MKKYSVTIWNTGTATMIGTGDSPRQWEWEIDIARQVAARQFNSSNLEEAQVDDKFVIREIGSQYPYAVLEPI